ncbi:MAG: hypothetical protein KKH44_04660, partial [Bacteroidetes bacterium]|nr:hypothetical protein [Bacteroidota bacterium]
SGDEVIRFKLFLTNYLHHPTVLIRNSILKKHNLLYPNFLHAEDYALWLKLIKHCKVEILSEPLLKYRVHDANISILNSEFQKRQTSKLRENEIDKLGLEWNDQQSKTFNMFIDQKKVLDFKTLINCCDVLSKIWQNKFNSSICFEFFKYELTYFIESNLTKVSNSDIQIFSKSKFSHSPKQIFRYHLKKTFGG